ncbi:MAG: Fic family protein [Ilumatobacteraceae bacterium]
MSEVTTDHAYSGIARFAEWADGLTSSARYNDFASDWRNSAASAAPGDADDALSYVLRTAAIETGAIEHLYQVDRGITFSVAVQAAAWQAELHAIGDDVLGHFEAQLGAYEAILDVATTLRPLTQVWLRELHATITAGQETYRVAVDVDPIRWEDRPLGHGSYKDTPNNVTLPDGSVHWYCPVGDVEAEVAMLLSELDTPAFLNSPPVIQSAYLHHGLTAIHPFADGNGRVARAAASIYLYRSGGVPLLIFADQSHHYRVALMEADAGSRQRLVDFVEDRALDALNMIRQQFELLRVGDPAEQLHRVLTGHGGLPFAVVEQLGYRLREDLEKAADDFLKTRVPPGVGMSRMSMSDRCSFGLPYHSPPGQTGFKIRLTCSEPVDTGVDCTPMVGIADDIGERFALIAMDASRPDRRPLMLRIDDLHPSMSVSARMNLEQWVAATFGGALSHLAESVESGLRARGFTRG